MSLATPGQTTWPLRCSICKIIWRVRQKHLRQRHHYHNFLSTGITIRSFIATVAEWLCFTCALVLYAGRPAIKNATPSTSCACFKRWQIMNILFNTSVWKSYRNTSLMPRKMCSPRCHMLCTRRTRTRIRTNEAFAALRRNEVFLIIFLTGGEARAATIVIFL